MESVQKFQQAYLQAPWRRQLQIALTFLLVLVSVAIVAYIYLNVTTSAAALGREVQYMQVSGAYGLTQEYTGDLSIEELKQDIADLEAQLGQLTSYQVLDERARELDLEPATPDQIVYMEVPGYQGRQPAVMAPPPEPVIVSAAGISPDFRESLVDWIKMEILQTAQLFKEVQP